MEQTTNARDFLAVPHTTVVTGDATLAVRRFGSGPPLLLVHGFPLHGFTWRHVLPALAAHRTCLVPDLAGCGSSDWTPQTDFGFEGHARRLALLLQQSGIDRCEVLAHDTGATTARCLALQVPDVVSKLVLINTEIPHHRPPLVGEYQALLAVPGTTWAFRQLLRSAAYVRSGVGLGGCFTDPRLLQGEFHDRFLAPITASARAADGVVRYLRGVHWPTVDGMETRHGQIRAPVRFVWGVDDETFPLRHARPMLAQFTAPCDLVPIANTRLFPHEERPAEVAAAVLEFLAG